MHVFAVREISAYLKELLDTNPVLGDVWIAGECSNVGRPPSGHVYFTLKDQQAQMKAVFFSQKFNVRSRTAQLIENGHAVLAHGRVSLYEPRGDLQLIVDYVQPEGAGALQAEFERLKDKLGAEGLFDGSRKRPLPAKPRRIGVVTSPTGAVFHDICHVLDRRWPLAEIVLAPAPVQGPSAVPGLIAGIHALNGLADIDVIILARGGGAVEELWAFNDEALARALFASAVPVISAVGHETDFTIADYVADRRAPTPSAAAEIVSPNQVEVAAQIRLDTVRMDNALRHRCARESAAVQEATNRLRRRLPDVQSRREQVDNNQRRATNAAGDLRTRVVHAVGSYVWRLKALDPYATLDRGYAIVQGLQRRHEVISSVAAVSPGDPLDVRVKDGTFQAVAGKRAPVSRKRPRRGHLDAQAPLFTMPAERA